MDKFNKIATTINATSGLHEMEQQVRKVKQSNLPEDKKQRALKSHNKTMKITILLVIILTIIMTIAMLVGFSISEEVGVIISGITLILMPTILITYVIVARKKNLFSDWSNAYDKVDKGFDGLNDEEIIKLKPNVNEEAIIKKYKKKSLISGLIFLLALVIEFSIILLLEIKIYSPVTIIVSLIITGIWYFFEDTYQVEIHRIKSGYYKKSFCFICQKCRSEVKINFEDLEKYDSLPRNEQGIRVMNCHNCSNPVPFYNFDNALESYKEYLNMVNKK